MSEIKKYFEHDAVIDRFKEVLGNETAANSFIASVLLEVMTHEGKGNYNLQLCPPKSIYSAAMKAATLRLHVGRELGEAWLIPRFNKNIGAVDAYFQIGWQGWYKMAMRTNQYRFINVSHIKPGTTVAFDEITGAARIEYDKNSDGGVVASFETLRGYGHTIFWDYAKLREHEAQYGNNNPIWSKHRADMQKKTVGTHLLKKWGVFNEDDSTVIQSFREDDDVIDQATDNNLDAALLVSGNDLGQVVEGELIDDKGNYQKQSPQRPYDAKTVKQKVTEFALSFSPEETLNMPDVRRQVLASVLDTTLGDKTMRYELCEWLTGTASTKEIEAGYVLAMLKWQGVNSFDQMPSDEVIAETKACHSAALVAKGKLEMPV